MRFYIGEIGQGPKRTRNLSREEAREAMELILSNEVPRSQMGAFLLLQRFRGESPDELLGFADAMRHHARLIRPKVDQLLDVGSPYDGRVRNVVVSPAASIVAAAAGLPVVMHGAKDMPPKHGVAVGDVLRALGVPVDEEAERVEVSIEEDGFGYMNLERVAPDLYAFKDLREEMGLRTGVSTVEKLYNLAGASCSIIGLTHVPYMDKMLETVGQMGFRRIMIVQGMEGNEDVPTSRPCRVFESTGGGVKEYRVSGKDYGLQVATQQEMSGGDAAYNAELTLRVLNGEKGWMRDLVLLNSGMRLYLGEIAPSIGDGIEVARQALDAGAAASKLQALRDRSTVRGKV
jgi:anthranilate phosphoribosyltransferase